ncbi:MAG: septum site-determining protein MinC [Syntrophomonadaceae bacterium]|jgi:septum site-determining protein MinC
MIKIKGVNGNLVFFFESDDFNKQYQYLQNKFENNHQLLSGARVIFTGGGLDNFSHEQFISLQRLCLDYGAVLNNTELPIKKAAPPPSPSLQAAARSNNDLFIHRNLRSGQKIRSEGSIVVWGDVHESAEIIAAGDIIILGKLAGIAHAGCYGDINAIVFALNLCPSQIRIGNRISRASGNDSSRNIAEVACCDYGGIIIKEYNPRENLGRS